MIAYLKLIKIDNLLILAIAQLCIKYGFFDPFNVATTLHGTGMVVLIISTMSIGAAGNIIIQIYNQENVSSLGLLDGAISEKSANRWFIILNIIGVLIGFYLANLIGKPEFSALFVIVSAIFYIYASYLKEIVILKNLSIALLIYLGLVVVPIFDLLPAITDNNRVFQKIIFQIISDYALFAFILIVIREIIKDCCAVDKDHNSGCRTIPIIMGKERTVKLISGLTIIPIGLVTYYVYTNLFKNTYAVIYILIFLIAPLLYFMFKSWGAQSNRDFNILSWVLKIILLLTSFSLLFHQLILTQ